MIRQAKRKRTRECHKEIDKLLRLSADIYKKNSDLILKMRDHQESLKKGTCEDKLLQSFYNMVSNVARRVASLQNEITKLNGHNVKSEQG